MSDSQIPVHETITASNRISDVKVFAAVFGLLTAIYALTAQWGLPYHIDAMTNAVTASQLARERTVILHRYEPFVGPDYVGNVAWLRESPSGVVGQYPPGTAIMAAPIYALSDNSLQVVTGVGTNQPDTLVEFPTPPLWPATASAVAVTGGAMSVLALVVRREGASVAAAIAVGVTAGLASAAWSVAADMSWQHGPAMLWIALGLLGAQRSRWLPSGLAFGCAVLTRPHTAVIAAATGLYTSIRTRSWKPILGIGLGSAIGLAGLLWFNYAIWGKLTLSGGYTSGFTDRFITESPTWFLSNLLGGLIDPAHGLLVWAPFLVPLTYAAYRSKDSAPHWMTGAALGGVVYLIVQFRANRFSGGDGHLGYRYPLEAMMACAPLLVLGFQQWIRARPLLLKLTVVTLGVATAAQLAAAVA